MADTEGVRPSATMFNDITKLLEQDGGQFVMAYNITGHDRKEWIVGLTWGVEAPDSPMAGAAAYGVDEVAGIAVEKALREAGI